MSLRFTVGKWVNGLAEWTEGDTAFLSIAFTWKVDEAYSRAAYDASAKSADRVDVYDPATGLFA